MNRSLNFLVAVCERIVLIAVAAPYVMAIARSLPTHPTFFLAAASEILAAFFVLIQKRGEVTIRAYALTIAVAGTCASMLVRPGGEQVPPPVVTGTMMFVGLAISVWSKLVLNRSFGIFAANRGVKNSGPYRLVRHPMYLGYIISQLGFLAANLSTRNAVVYAVAWTFQLARILEEEKLLRQDEAYRSFSERVRYRLVPGVF